MTWYEWMRIFVWVVFIPPISYGCYVVLHKKQALVPDEAIPYGKQIDIAILFTLQICIMAVLVVLELFGVVLPWWLQLLFAAPVYAAAYISYTNFKVQAERIKAQQAAQAVTSTQNQWVTYITGKLNVPPALNTEIIRAITEYVTKHDPHTLTQYSMPGDGIANDISTITAILPPGNLIKVASHGQLWESYIADFFGRIAQQKSKDIPISDLSIMSAYHRLPTPLRDALRSIPIAISIPDHLRTQHLHCLASTGYGKSQLFQSMVLDDLETDIGIVVIDSQDDLVNKLATRIDPSRLILIDPVACPPALNVFKLNDPTLLEYVFGALDAQMTSKQGMVYRYLSRHVMQQNGTISLLLDVLTNPDQTYSPDGQAATAFFDEYKRPKGQYADTRQEILRRLLTLLESKSFELMMMAPDLRINMSQAIDQKKVVLINTAKPMVGNAAAALFGRFWLALLLKEVMKGQRNRVNLYVDEFGDYASDELEPFFTQARKYNLAMTCAHQSLAQLPEKLRAIMATNTAIKMVGGVSAEDRGNLARQMDCEPEFIAKAKRGTFAAWFRDLGTYYYPVKFGKLEALPEITPLSTIRDTMRKKYGPPPIDPARPRTTPPPKKGDRVDETGKW